jgi:hypothetical protein
MCFPTFPLFSHKTLEKTYAVTRRSADFYPAEILSPLERLIMRRIRYFRLSANLPLYRLNPVLQVLNLFVQSV